jgi:predicted alpha/beta-fold hydrolase
MANMQTRCFFSHTFSSDWLSPSEQRHHFSHITLRKEERTTVCVALAYKKQRKHQQENVGENVCLFSALTSHHAAKSNIRKVKSSMSNETNTSFGSLKQINAGLLNVGYAEAGKSDGPAVMLLHGWPYDIHSYVDVAPRLSQAGYRVIVPYLRGYGTTRFLSSETFRNGQQSVVAVDTIALMDALKIEKAILAGFDWGARTADIIAAIPDDQMLAILMQRDW